MKITIELNDTYEYNGKLYTPTGEYRAPECGEMFINMFDRAAKCRYESQSASFLILKPKRWRADEGDIYWFICNTGELTTDEDMYYSGHNKRYELGNYFQNKEQAEAARDKIKELLLSMNLD